MFASRRTYPALFGSALLAVAGCAPSVSDAEKRQRELTRQAAIIEPVLKAQDLRVWDAAAFARGLGDGASELRRLTTLAVGRIASAGPGSGIEPAAALPLLSPRLDDADPEVRAAAAFGLGLVALGEAGAALAKRFEVETEPSVKIAILRAAARCGDDASIALLQGNLGGDDPVLAIAANTALGVAARQLDRKLPEKLVEPVARVSIGAKAPELRAAAIYALWRGDRAASVVDFLNRSLKDGDPGVRRRAVRALSEVDPKSRPAERIDTVALMAQLVDPDPWIRIEAFRAAAALKPQGADQVIASELASSWGRWRSGTPGPAELSVMVTAAEAIPALRAVRAMDIVQRIYEESERRLVDPEFAGQPKEKKRRPDLARVNCAMARAIDLFDRRLSKIPTCGAGEVSSWLRRQWIAGWVGAQSSDDLRRIGILKGLLGEEDSRARVAATDALAGIEHEDARTLLAKLLRHSDRFVAASAADRLSSLPLLGVAGPILSAVARVKSPVEAQISLLQAAAVVTAREDREGLGRFRDPARKVLEPLLGSRDYAVARLASAAMLAAGAENDGPSPLPARTVIDEALAYEILDSPETLKVTLKTTRGPVELELLVREAPLTVRSFVALARRGFYDNLPFHRVVPGFVVQGGDPRGDGWGGPGYTIRCELNDLPYERGAVGMALAGRDTGGSQFFVTQVDQPHLEGAYTVFGRVRSGMDRIDAMQPGDLILGVQLPGGATRDAPAQAPPSGG